ncbi:MULTISPECIES: MerR family transcriptional regulator [unclassified Actinomyces]|uniref:MerR family transcriptional regulator n=1 Tax=unclassified Actinomyces TaxID=2609248 RepID=UPI0013743C8D|nr:MULTISPECIES: MerR family transcriptional regulator [unclassified Actinomyces]MBW3068143.1 MerR family transcriptional regulator [Actinomyces sp. 594]NDR54564.1 MerR family transcriptional regulator [Actinomyces sp. 565]QHO91075.1 MerR family transcriptional regulator [Actinomyces sp. 432]
MRVAEIARLTGTSVRTVRYYHSLGLLPVPEERGGWRDYDLGHVARLSRIRWLVQAGVPLKAIGHILGRSAEQEEGPDAAATVITDLSGALYAVQEHLDGVLRQRDMLIGLLKRAQEGLTVSPMPPRMVAFFDRLEAAAPDERTRAAVRRERDLVDVACYSGRMPPAAELIFPEPDDGEDADALAAYGRDTAGLSDAQIEERAADNIARFERVLGPQRCRELAEDFDTASVRPLFQLIAAVEPGYARMAEAMERLLIEAIARWRAR